jgi:parallel beta-helix repeat protein
MKTRMNPSPAGLALGALFLLFGACSDEDDSGPCDVTIAQSLDDQTNVQRALILIGEGQTLCIDAGEYSFTAELSLDVDDVTVRGAGMDETVLNFSGQEVGAGANGIKVSSNGVTFEDLQVLDTPGDGIRVDDANDITFRRVWVSWTQAESLENGAYGLYPVGCENVIIEDCKVNGARDAGIYVGQSNEILVQRNEVWGNVAGIEIENSNESEVRDNHVHDNSSGILVFNLPGLAQNGSRANVHTNLVESNNVPNFGVEGTIVAVVPGGTGVIVLACDDNEFHNNEIRGNRTAGVIIFSYFPGLFGVFDDENFDVNPQGNWFHDNTYADNGGAPIGTLHAILPDEVVPSPSPDILWDGCAPPAEGSDSALCIQESNVTYLNFDMCSGFVNPSSDQAPLDCSGETLPSRE